MKKKPPQLGRVASVDLRTVWDDESRSFTPWLAKPENIQVLSDEIGIELEVDATEVPIGSFKADIVCKSIDDATVIIENQLGRTNHDHLGKLITYASGLSAKYIIWICRNATLEHRRAVDWLNETTIEGTNYFLLEVKVWKIGHSNLAPKFNVVCSPNEWAKEVVGGTSQRGPMTATKQDHLQFWNGLKDYMSEQNTFLRLRKPRPQHWYSLALGRSRFHISLTRNTNSDQVGCEVYMRGTQAKTAFALLKKQKDKIEKELGKLEWQELPEGQDCRIIQHKDAEVEDKKEWPVQYKWLKQRAEAFHETFSERVRELDV